MRIMLSNDDGYDAPGLRALHEAVSRVAEVIVVAPEGNYSGCSSALTLRRPISVRSRGDGVISVDGTPADCVHLAINGMLDVVPDMVISGINNGPNFGDDVIYSGTVAAVIEARFLRLPGIAVSLAGGALKHYDTAAAVTLDLLTRLRSFPLSGDCMLNVNVPDVPRDALRGVELTRLGRRRQSQPITREPDLDGARRFHIGRPGEVVDEGAGADFHAVRENRVSVTPISIDMTDYNRIREVSEWLERE